MTFFLCLLTCIIIIFLATFALIIIILSVFFIESVMTLIFAVCNHLRVEIYDVESELKLIQE